MRKIKLIDFNRIDIHFNRHLLIRKICLLNLVIIPIFLKTVFIKDKSYIFMWFKVQLKFKYSF